MGDDALTAEEWENVRHNELLYAQNFLRYLELTRTPKGDRLKPDEYLLCLELVDLFRERLAEVRELMAGDRVMR